MARPKNLKKLYELKLGKVIVSKLSDAQLSTLSKYYNSLSDKEREELDKKISKGSKNDLLEIATGMIEENEADEPIPEGLDNLLSEITGNKKDKQDQKQEDDNDKSSSSPSALATIPKEDNQKKTGEKKDTINDEDFVEEEIDSRILDILRIKDTFDLTYGEYKTLLREKAAAGRMGSSTTSTNDTELITNEFKRVKNKESDKKIKIKKKVVKVEELFKRTAGPKKQQLDPKKLLPPEKTDKKEDAALSPERNRESSLNRSLSSILSVLNDIRSILDQQLLADRQSQESLRREQQKTGKRERESRLESRDDKSPVIKDLASKIEIPFFDRIKKYFGNIFAGSVVVGLLNWLNDPKNKKSVDNFKEFFINQGPLILGGILALTLLPVASTLLSFTGAILGGIGTLAKALGGLALKIPGLAPFLGMTVLAPAVAGGATAAFAKWGSPAIMDAATKLDLGVAAAQDPLVREAYSKIKEEGKAYKTTTGRGGKKVRVEKSSSEMNKEEKKAFDDARKKEAKTRELAVEYSRSNQEIYDLNQKIKQLEKETPKNLPGGRSRTQEDINSNIQNIKNQIKEKEKEKESKKKTLYEYLNIDPSKQQPQTQPSSTPPPSSGMPGLPPSAAQPGTGPAGNLVGSSSVPNQAGLPPLPPTNTLPGKQHYGASRDGGTRKHAGVDFDISGNEKFYSRIGGVVVSNPFRYGADGWGIDIYNQQLGVYERIAEAARVLVKKGETVSPGQAVVQGESETGVIHYEIRKKIEGGYEGTLDPMAFLGNPTRQNGTPPSGQIAGISPSQAAPSITPFFSSPLIITGPSKSQAQSINPPGGGSSSSANQAPVPSFSSEDPNNFTTMVVKGIYNVVG